MKVFAALAVVVVVAMYSVSYWRGQPPASLLTAAVLILFLGLGHSVMGEQRLVRPLLALPGLPTPRGSVEQTRIIVRLSWHALSIMWWGLGAVLAWSHFSPSDVSRPFLIMVTTVSFISGAAVLAGTRGGHPSWIYFFLIAGLVGHRAALG